MGVTSQSPGTWQSKIKMRERRESRNILGFHPPPTIWKLCKLKVTRGEKQTMNIDLGAELNLKTKLVN